MRRTLIPFGLLLVSCATTADASFDLATARRDAAHRPRRVIMNNDGNDCIDLPANDTPRTPTEMLSRRTTPLLGSHVDSIFYCDGVFDSYTHQSAESEMRRDVSGGRAAWGDLLYEQFSVDPLTIIIEHCQQHRIEVFWSMRMNDTHDSSPQYAMLLPEWKKQHPELLISTADARPPFGGRRWSAVEYGKAAVREKVFRIIEDVVTRYDVDGIELDFFRHPVYFAPAARGEPVPKDLQDELTELLRRIRALVDTTAASRRKPILIAARLPDSVPFCRAMGLDLERWLDERLLDLIAGSGYVHLRPWEDWVALGRRWDIPVYACLSASRLVSASAPEDEADLPLWRGEALRAWEAGVDGIYTFNRFDPHSSLFLELGDPEVLRALPHRYEFVPGSAGHLRTWVKDGASYVVPDQRELSASSMVTPKT